MLSRIWYNFPTNFRFYFFEFSVTKLFNIQSFLHYRFKINVVWVYIFLMYPWGKGIQFEKLVYPLDNCILSLIFSHHDRVWVLKNYGC
jgi:hypothetical protein